MAPGAGLNDWVARAANCQHFTCERIVRAKLLKINTNAGHPNNEAETVYVLRRTLEMKD